jgi:DNA-binding LytR/AlgR family response regulator
MSALIIEDELPAAKQLAKLLSRLSPSIAVIETLDSVSGAVNWLQTFSPPALIFMDIQIADGLSFDIFKQTTVASPVIFTTAFDQYAIQAFKVNAVDYLLKPIEQQELAAAVARVRERREIPPIDYRQLARAMEQPAYKTRFLVKSGQGMIFLSDQDIAWFQSSGGLTQACTVQGKKYFVDHTLEDLEQLLNPADFFRISRAMTLRATAVQKIHTHFNGRLKLELMPVCSEEVFVSRERVNAFKTWLGGGG